MQSIYVDTVSAINFSNGVVRITMVEQDPEISPEEIANLEDYQPRMKQQVVMPLPGFLYMMNVIQGLMEDPKMQDVIKRHVDAGLMPIAEESEETAEAAE